MYPYIITEQKITVVIDGKIFSVYQSDNATLYETVKKAIYAGDKETVYTLTNPAKTVEEACKETSEITYAHGFVWYRDVQVNNYVVDRILELKKSGADVKRLEKLLVNLYDNPNKEVIPYLYEFLEYGGNPITEDGTFLAFKRVRANYRDIHSGKFDNSPGVTVTEDRSVVNSDRNTTCARGLHFCSWEYLPSFGSCDSSNDRVVIVEINPADVVMIPSDYNNTKARCCKYKVLYDYGKPWGQIKIEDLKLELAKASVNIHPEVVTTPVYDEQKAKAVTATGRSVLKTIIDLIDEYCGVEAEVYSHLQHDLELDSLDYVELIMMIEDEFNIEIPDDEAEKLGVNATVSKLWQALIANYGDKLQSRMSADEKRMYEDRRTTQVAPTVSVNKTLPARGPDGRFLPKTASKTPVQLNVDVGVVRKLNNTSQYWNGVEWKPHFKGERLRTAKGWFIANQYLAVDGYFYIE